MEVTNEMLEQYPWLKSPDFLGVCEVPTGYTALVLTICKEIKQWLDDNAVPPSNYKLKRAWAASSLQWSSCIVDNNNIEDCELSGQLYKEVIGHYIQQSSYICGMCGCCTNTNYNVRYSHVVLCKNCAKKWDF